MSWDALERDKRPHQNWSKKNKMVSEQNIITAWEKGQNNILGNKKDEWLKRIMQNSSEKYRPGMPMDRTK